MLPQIPAAKTLMACAFEDRPSMRWLFNNKNVTAERLWRKRARDDSSIPMSLSLESLTANHKTHSLGDRHASSSLN